MENRCFELFFYFLKVTRYLKLFHVKFRKLSAMLSGIERAHMNQLNHYSSLVEPISPLETLKQDEPQPSSFTYEGEAQSRAAHSCWTPSTVQT